MAEPEPSNVHPLRPGPDYLELLNLNASMGEELAATRKALAAAHTKATRLQKKLNDEQGTAADMETVTKVLEYWRDKTGRDKKTRIDLTTKRAQLVRWALKAWEPREVCLMVRGVLKDRWYVEHKKTDVKHILADEERAEHFLRLGRGS